MWPDRHLWGRRNREPHFDYSVEADLDHVSIWPYDFYLLKPGAKAKYAQRSVGDTPTRRTGRSLAPMKWLPLDSDDIAQLRTLIYDAYWLCPSLWVSYMYGRTTYGAT